MRRFTVGVNLLWLVPGLVGGSEEYTIRLLQGVGPYLDEGVTLRLYGRPELFANYPDLADLHDCVVWKASRSTKFGRIVGENTWLAAATRNDDAVHHAGGTIPFVRTPFVGHPPAVVTIHDLQPLEFPENFGAAKRLWLGRAIPSAAKRARLVLCPSEFTGSRVAALLSVPDEKIRVVPHGHQVADQGGRSGLVVPGDDAGATVYTEFEAPQERFGPYLLYPAIAYPHKRHIDIVRALDGLDGRFDQLSVVFTGREGPELSTVLDEARRLGLAHRVHALGRIPEAELESLYRDAEALVFPSSYEGFGNPALEAMNLGCPVIASDGGALPEVVGDAGMVVPVGNIRALIGAIEKVLADPSLSEDLCRKGAVRARRFDIGIAAWRLAEVYRELVTLHR